MKFIVETAKGTTFTTNEIDIILGYMANGLTADIGVISNCNTVDQNSLLNCGNGAWIVRPMPRNEGTYI